MANFYAQYASPAQVNIAAEGANGGPAPTESLLVAGENPSGNLQPLQTDSSGNLLVSLNGDTVNPIPVQDIAAEASLASIDGKTVHVDTGNVTVVASALPTGAATQTTLATVSTTLGSILLDLTNGTQITQISGTIPLPAGASTAANQATEIASLASIVTNTGNIPAVGQKTSAASLPVVIASDQSALPISGSVTVTGGATSALQTAGNSLLTTVASNQTNGTQVTAVNNFPATQAISAAALPLPTGASISALQSNVQSAPGTPQTVALTIQGNASSVAVPMSAAALPLPTGAATSANQATGITSLASIVSNTNESTTTAITSVSSSASSVQLLASNSSRKMATFYNSSTSILFLKLGTTASSSSYTLQMAPGSYYELPARQYTGEIDGIWASVNGAVLITELS